VHRPFTLILPHPASRFVRPSISRSHAPVGKLSKFDFGRTAVWLCAEARQASGSAQASGQVQQALGLVFCRLIVGFVRGTLRFRSSVGGFDGTENGARIAKKTSRRSSGNSNSRQDRVSAFKTTPDAQWPNDLQRPVQCHLPDPETLPSGADGRCRSRCRAYDRTHVASISDLSGPCFRAIPRQFQVFQ